MHTQKSEIKRFDVIDTENKVQDVQIWVCFLEAQEACPSGKLQT
jgi:hypothetical protein